MSVGEQVYCEVCRKCVGWDVDGVWCGVGVQCGIVYLCNDKTAHCLSSALKRSVLLFASHMSVLSAKEASRLGRSSASAHVRQSDQPVSSLFYMHIQPRGVYM